jgi:hypothetical protein
MIYIDVKMGNNMLKIVGRECYSHFNIEIK